ncbi:L,D-transpeptidase [Mesorhizobium sp. IMUNJ 23232]|uniref:L,D-transpeptidase n=1 Tax=Mesorhizobium sp. IMUNJ 23232 TaxID=3376064 RepID=UPI0037974FD3
MSAENIARRGLLLVGLALMASGCIPSIGGFRGSSSTVTLDRRYKRQRVAYESAEPAGSIVVDTSQRFLYSIEGSGYAMRYGVGVGQEGLTLKGRATIGRKAVWPSWTPSASMIRRKPRLAQYAGGVSGGPNNPLGARALYLYRGGHDTRFRLHGTNEPWTIGTAVSSGCIRLTNDDIIDLYERTPEGTTVIVI